MSSSQCQSLNVSVVFLLCHLLNLKSKQTTRNCPLIWQVKMWSLTFYVISLVYSCTRSSGEAWAKQQQADETAWFCAVNLQLPNHKYRWDDQFYIQVSFWLQFPVSPVVVLKMNDERWTWDRAHQIARSPHDYFQWATPCLLSGWREFSPLCIGTRFFFLKTYKMLPSCLWGVSLTHPVLAALCGEFLLHIPCWLLFLCGEFFLRVVVEVLLYVHRNRRFIRDGSGQKSRTSTFTQLLSTASHLYIPCWLFM